MKKSRTEGRRPPPKRQPVRRGAPRKLTVGDLVSAAYEALGETGPVLRVLTSRQLSERVSRRLVFI